MRWTRFGVAVALSFLFAQASIPQDVNPSPAAPAPAAPAAAPATPAAPTAPAPAKPQWFTSFDKASAEAKNSGKPILADFTGSDWCPWCIKLRKEVFDTKTFKEWAAKNVVLLEVDFPRSKAQDAATKKANRELGQKYNIKGYPTVVFMSADGTQLGQSGYEPGGATTWIKDAQKILAAATPAAK